MPTDLTLVVNILQTVNQTLAKIQQTLASGSPVPLPVYTVAALPASAQTGALAYASNGRKTGEGGGAGTGTPVWFNVSGQWFAVWSSAQVTS